MEPRHKRAAKRAPRRRAWITAIALAATIPLALTSPVIAQELDPLDAMRAEFDACIASGADGAVCAAEAKLLLDAIISGGDAVSTGTQTSSASGQDGERSNGGEAAITDDASGDQVEDPAISDDAAGDQAEDPAPVSGDTSEPAAAPPPPVDAAPADGTASTTTTTESDPGTTSTLSGGAQTHDASGTDGGRPRQ